MKTSLKTLTAAALLVVGFVAPVHAATAATGVIRNNDGAPKVVKLPNGTSLRLSSHAEVHVAPDGALTIVRGIVLVESVGPTQVTAGGVTSTVSGGTYFLQSKSTGGLRLVAVAGDATIASGGKTVSVPEGSQGGLLTTKAGVVAMPTVAIDLGAMASGSALMQAAPLSASVQSALGNQRDAIAAGDLVPTNAIIVAVSAEKGMGFAPATDVQTALTNGSTGIQIQLTNADGESVAVSTPTAPGTPTSPTTPTTTPTSTSGITTSGTFAMLGGSGSTTTVKGSNVINQNYPYFLGADTLVFEKGASVALTAGNPSKDHELGVYTPGYKGPLSLDGVTLNSIKSLFVETSRNDINIINSSLTSPGIWIGAGDRSSDNGNLTISDTTLAGNNIEVYGRHNVALTNLTVKTVATDTASFPIFRVSRGEGVWDYIRQATIDGVTLTAHETRIDALTINLKNYTFAGSDNVLNSRDGVLNIGSSLMGAVNFISGVKYSDGTTTKDLTTKDGINAVVKLGSGGIRYQGGDITGTPLDGTIGASDIDAKITIGDPTRHVYPSINNNLGPSVVYTAGSGLHGVDIAFVSSPVFETTKDYQFTGDKVTFADNISLVIPMTGSDGVSNLHFDTTREVAAKGVAFDAAYFELHGRSIALTDCRIGTEATEGWGHWYWISADFSTADSTITLDGCTVVPGEFEAAKSIVVKNTTFVKDTTAIDPNGYVEMNINGYNLTNTDPSTVDARIELDTVTFDPTHTLLASARTISLKNVTFDHGSLSSRDGVLNIAANGLAVDGAVNFIGTVKTSDNTDLTTAAGINDKVHVETGDIRLNNAKMAGATGAGAGAPISVFKR